MNIKKSGVDLTDLALGIVILGIVVSVGAVILINVRDNQVSNIDTTTVSNEGFTATDGSYNLVTTGVKSLTSVTNASGGETISSGNYTFTASDIGGVATIDWVGTSPYNGTTVNATYEAYDATDPRYSLPDNATTGLAEYGNWFDIIVIVGVAAVILALIFMAFGKRGGEAGISY